MQIVVSHNSLDFDALAAQFAVTKLNPTARIALCGPVLGTTRDFLALYRNRLSLILMKHLRDKEKEISKIFIVDCQHIQRLDPIIQKLINDGTPYAVIDHHDFDDKGLGVNAQTDSIIDCVGAATTLLVEQIQKKNLKITPFEASLLALGIYEDTGALTYSTTTARDAACVTFLLQNGADLKIINEYMRAKLKEPQQALFEQLISRAQVINMAGNKIVFAGATCADYIDGLAILTRKLTEVESADAAITAVHMRDRTYLVGRSDTTTINVREVMRLYDGDGHAGAASAVVKGEQKLTPAEILSDIEHFLRKNIQPELTAVQIMSAQVKMILPRISMEEAGKIMIRHDIDGLLIVEEGKILGVISKRDVDQAQHHQLGHASVLGFMSRPVISVKADTTFSEIQSILIRNNIGRVPVLDDNGHLLGIVSRGDILQALFHEPISFGHDNLPMTQMQTVGRKITPDDYKSNSKLQDPLLSLDADNLWLYQTIGAVANELNMVAYAVGGSVRDMLLGLSNFDLDFVIEGSAIALAEKLVEKYPEKFILANKHERFQTATIHFICQDKREVDLSTARQEFYEYPAALPTVEPSLLREDASRRDFTINTLVFSLDPNSFGTLVDYFNGLEDLQAGQIRVMHQLSFIEDPTRILRAARFASRFGFTIDDNTAQLASHAIEMGIFDNLAGVRMKEELRLILESPNRLIALEILSHLGAKLRYLDEELEYGPEQRKIIRRAQRVLPKYLSIENEAWLVYLALLLSSLSAARLENVLARLHLTSEVRVAIIRGLAIDEELMRLGKHPKRSDIYKVLHGSSPISLGIAASLSAPGSPVRRAIKLYFEELINVKVILTGQDLLKMGFKEGRELGQVLQALLNARLDQFVNNRQEEMAFIKTELANKL